MKNELFYKLQGVGEVDILSCNDFLIGSERLEGDVGLILFE